MEQSENTTVIPAGQAGTVHVTQGPVFELTPPTEREILAALVSELMAECVRVTGEGNYDVWCHYSGHVDSIRISASKAPWVEGVQDCLELYVFLAKDLADYPCGVSGVREALEKVAALGVDHD